jgi:hypothetical protein
VTIIRQTIADALVAGLDERYAVYGYPRNPDTITGTTRPVCVWLDTIDRGVTFQRVALAAVVWVLTGRTDETDATENELEDALSDVLGVLDDATAAGQVFVWKKATRGVLEDTWHGYRVEVSAAGTLTPPAPAVALLKE